jgi:hypothetical protein
MRSPPDQLEVRLFISIIIPKRPGVYRIDIKSKNSYFRKNSKFACFEFRYTK